MTIGIICPGNHLESWQADWLESVKDSFQFILVGWPVKDSTPLLVRRLLPKVAVKTVAEPATPVTFYINFTSDSSIKKDVPVIHIDFLLTSYATILLPLQRHSPVTAVRLYRSERNDSGICYEGVFRTVRHSVAKHIRLITYQTSALLTDYIKKQSGFKKSTTLPSKPEINLATLNRRVTAAYFRHRFNQLFTSYRWNIGIVKTAPEDLLDGPSLHTVQWMKEEHGKEFNADPFMLPGENGLRIYFEHMLEGVRGVICTTEYNKQEFSAYKWVLEKNNHLSYPFALSYNNKNYIIPESADDNEVKLHEVNASGEIIDGRVIIPDFDAVDPTVIHWNNEWWLFCTRKENKSPDLRLYIFYADDPFGKWTQHESNPVKCDISNARPAGNMFIHNNKLYRPAQDSSETYGGRVVINEVTDLTHSTFSEKPVAYVEPKQFGERYSEGIHTISFFNGYMAVDGKRRVLSLFSL